MSVLNDEVSKKVMDILKEEGVDFVVNLPEDSTANLTDKISVDNYFTYVRVTNEDQGIAFAAGASLAGKKPVFITGIGLLVGAWALSMMRIVYNTPLVLLIAYRGTVGDRSASYVPAPYLDLFGQVAEPLLQALKIPYLEVGKVADLKRTISDAVFTSVEQQTPVGVLLSGEVLW
ncbi:MAG: thiamine pyrophosphate-binding protein [Nitrososphaerales archaeon]